MLMMIGKNFPSQEENEFEFKHQFDCYRSRINIKMQVQFFYSIPRSHKCRTIYTRFHASMFSSIVIFMWWKVLDMSLYICYARRQSSIPRAS